jgi:hypothetical protein
MLRRVSISLAVLLFAAPIWCQVEPSASGGSGESSDDSPMPLTPQVSGSFYPSSTGSQAHTNTLSGGVVVTASYIDNVLTGGSTTPLSAESYFISPTIRFDESASRTHAALAYSPGFTFYDPTTALNQVNQNLIGSYQYRVTPRVSLSIQDVFEQNSSIFSEPYTFSGATVSASPDSGGPILIVPYVGQIWNSTQGTIGYQFSRSSMIGASGSFSLFNYAGAAQQTNLYNSDSGGGGVFYSRRLTKTQYFGVTYHYSRTVTSPVTATSQSDSGSAFYTLYLGNRMTLSVSGGPEYSTTSFTGIPNSHTWGPSGSASLGWQQRHTNFALSYSRAITTGQGFLGTYTAQGANITAQWQITRRFSSGLNGSYSNVANATTFVGSGNPTGHTLFGRASVQYALTEHMNVIGEYSRLHESYQGISEIANDPNADRVSVTLNYQFTRPLGQ